MGAGGYDHKAFRVGLFQRQPVCLFHQIVGRKAGGTGINPFYPVSSDTVFREIERTTDRYINYPQYGDAVFYQCNIDREFSVPFDKLFCAVQRVYHP